MPTDNDKIFEKLMTFHSEFTEFRGEMKTRVTAMEQEMKDARYWENVKLFAILPITATLHTIATKIGFIKG